jgi:2-alkenal reductase
MASYRWDAIPVDVVNRIAGQLIRDGRVPAPGIGIVAASESEATRLGIDGIIIVRTLPQSPAAKAGLEGAANDGGVVQDVITAANGKPVHGMSDLANILDEVGVGNAVTLTVMRDGRPRSLDVTVTDISQQAGDLPAHRRTDFHVSSPLDRPTPTFGIPKA